MALLSADIATASTDRRHVVRGSMWYVVSVAITAVGGFAYWWLAARLEPSATVGRASALFTAVLFLNYATSMGLPIAVARFGNGEPTTVDVLWRWALLYTTAASMAGAVLFMLAAPYIFQTDVLDVIWARGPIAGTLLFFLLVTGMSFAVLVEVRLVTLRYWPWVVARVALIAVTRLPFLFVGAIAGAPIGLLVLMAGIPALSGFTGAALLTRVTRPTSRRALRPLPEESRTVLRYASVNWLALLASQAPQFTVPLIVQGSVDASEYAAFFLAWTVTTVVFLVPHTIGQVVLAEASRKVDTVSHQVRVGLALSLGLMVVAFAGAIALASVTTKIFGPDYALTGDLLPTLVAAGVPWSITAMLLARARVQGDSVSTVVITLGFAVATLVPIVVLVGRHGASGAAQAWLAGNLVAALIAVVTTAWARSSARTTLVVSTEPVGAAEG